MRLTISKNADVNYLAKLVEIKEFFPHPNPDVTRLKEAHIDGYKIAVGIDEQPGWFVYFPTMSCINPTILNYLNLYSKPEMNRDPETKPGFFGKNGRVRTIRLQKFPSEGFLLPIEALQSYFVDNINKRLPDKYEEIEFDQLEDNGKSLWICKKYIVPIQVSHNSYPKNRNDKAVKRFNKLIEGQFHFHYDTIILKKDPTVISPNDVIHISEKVHGTSGISAKILCRQKLGWFKKFVKWITGEEFNKYDYIYSSRKVVKNAIETKDPGGYYNCDVWGEADKVLRPYLTNGLTLYYEIVGFAPNGKYIQDGYDYGCIQPTDSAYLESTHFKIYIYRITVTGTDNVVYEFTPRQVKEWCEKRNLRPVTEYYYGYAKDLFKDLLVTDHWHENFLDSLSNCKEMYMEEDSPSCANKVPHEGIVIKKDNLVGAFKVKTFRFLSKEQDLLDKGLANIEDNA